MENLILQELENNPYFRERKNRTEIIATLLKEKYHLDIELSRLKAVIEDASTLDRYWRMCLKEYPQYRGFDYNTKKQVVQQKQIEYGYESGYSELSHLSKNL